MDMINNLRFIQKQAPQQSSGVEKQVSKQASKQARPCQYVMPATLGSARYEVECFLFPQFTEQAIFRNAIN